MLSLHRLRVILWKKNIYAMQRQVIIFSGSEYLCEVIITAKGIMSTK